MSAPVWPVKTLELPSPMMMSFFHVPTTFSMLR